MITLGEIFRRYGPAYRARYGSTLSNNRIERVANDEVTFRYTDGKTGAKKRATLPVDAFISRFLAHVLPKGFVKVRSYGLLCPGKRQLLNEARSLLTLHQAREEPPLQAAASQPERAAPDVRCCPSCGQQMQLVQTLQPRRRREQVLQPAPQATSRGPPFQHRWVVSWCEPTRCAQHTWLMACAVVVVSSSVDGRGRLVRSERAARRHHRQGLIH